jgi:calcineurin-like phosphoesterase family protein
MCARPFVEEMDATLRANWNAAVHPSDTVIHLAHFAHRYPAVCRDCSRH